MVFMLFDSSCSFLLYSFRSSPTDFYNKSSKANDCEKENVDHLEENVSILYF